MQFSASALMKAEGFSYLPPRAFTFDLGRIFSASISAAISELILPLIAKDIADLARRQMKRLQTASGSKKLDLVGAEVVRLINWI